MSHITFNYRNLLQSESISMGISNEQIDLAKDQIQMAATKIERNYGKNELGFIDLTEYDTNPIIHYVNGLDEKFDTFVVLGIGGSALGNKAIYSALKNKLGLSKKLIVLDNVDPHILYETLNNIDLEKTLFNVITKSGSTAETLSVFFIILDLLKKTFPTDYKKHLVITTDARKGFLRKFADHEQIHSFSVPDNVGGRFSVLSPVGLLSSAFLGIDIKSMLDGAKNMRKRCKEQDIMKNPAYLNGLLHYLLYQKGFNLSVMMPYSNELYDLADWYRQLWAESLGKKHDDNGNIVYVGQTPIKALGATDQHSQIQLYAEGPNDKITTFLSVEQFDYDYKIPELFPDDDSVSYLGGKKISTLLNYEKIATEYALYRAGRPNCTISFPNLNEYYIGEFIFLYELQTVFTGYLFNLNPLDQPGVEAGKIATHALMGKKGLEQERAALDSYIKQNKGAMI